MFGVEEDAAMDADAAAKKERKKKKKSKKKSNQSSVAFCIVDGDGAVKEVVKKDKKRKGENDKKKEKKKKRRKEADDAAAPATAPVAAPPAPAAPKTKTADNPTGATRLFMGNLPWSITDDQLSEACGCELKAIKRITDKESGKFYGSVFVEASDAAAAGAAVKRSGQDVGGRPVKIAFAPPRPGDVWPSAQIKLSPRISIMTSTPSTRCQLDGVAVWSLTARFSQHGRVVAEK